MTDGITYVGHSTTRIEVSGTRLLTDPILRSRIGHIRRIAALPPDPVAGIDAVLVSHAHHDHLDLPSLKLLPPGLPVLAPRGCAGLLRRRTRLDVIEVAPGARVPVGAVTVTALPARHDGRRVPVGPPRPAIGYLVEGTRRVAFYGDTDLFDEMGELAGTLDAALLPIWGWGPRVGPGHLDPERAARAAALLEPAIAVPIHWGTLAGPRVWWRADPELPARRFSAAAATVAPGVRVCVVAPGGRLALGSEPDGGAPVHQHPAPDGLHVPAPERQPGR
jgi:L-ascorbate metabolism protein UlaG (beta-lactamase superfamily)